MSTWGGSVWLWLAVVPILTAGCLEKGASISEAGQSGSGSPTDSESPSHESLAVTTNVTVHLLGAPSTSQDAPAGNDPVSTPLPAGTFDPTAAVPMPAGHVEWVSENLAVPSNATAFVRVWIRVVSPTIFSGTGSSLNDECNYHFYFGLFDGRFAGGRAIGYGTPTLLQEGDYPLDFEFQLEDLGEAEDVEFGSKMRMGLDACLNPSPTNPTIYVLGGSLQFDSTVRLQATANGPPAI